MLSCVQNWQLTSGNSASKKTIGCWLPTKSHLCGPRTSRTAAALWLACRGTPSRPGLLTGRWRSPLQPRVGTMTRMMTWLAPSLPALRAQLSQSRQTQQQMEERRGAPNQGSLGQAGRISSNLFLKTRDQSQSPGQVCTLQYPERGTCKQNTWVAKSHPLHGLRHLPSALTGAARQGSAPAGGHV